MLDPGGAVRAVGAGGAGDGVGMKRGTRAGGHVGRPGGGGLRERVRQIEVEALKKLQQQLNDDRPTRFFRENMPVEAPRKRPGRKRKDAPPQE